MLIDNLYKKDLRQTLMVQRKHALQDNCQRMNHAI